MRFKPQLADMGLVEYRELANLLITVCNNGGYPSGYSPLEVSILFDAYNGNTYIQNEHGILLSSHQNNFIYSLCLPCGDVMEMSEIVENYDFFEVETKFFIIDMIRQHPFLLEYIDMDDQNFLKHLPNV